MSIRTRAACPTYVKACEGFTLIELLVVMTVISILVAMAVPGFLLALDRSRQRATMGDIKSVGIIMETYFMDFDQYPNIITPPYANSNGTMEDLRNLLSPKFVRNLPWQDRWNNDFGFDTNLSNSYTIESFGKDGAPGLKLDQTTLNEFNRDILFTTGHFPYL